MSNPKRLLVPLAVIAIVLASGGSLAVAQNTAAPDRTAELLKKVQDLEYALAAIKTELAQRGLVPAATATPVASALPAAPAMSAETVAALTAVSVPNDSHQLGPLEFHGYGDFTYGRPVTSVLPPGGLSGTTQSFSLGDFDLFVSSDLGNHLSMIGELLITSDFTNQFSAEIDRLLLTYSANKYFQISAGKYHTAIGYYSNEFHRARYYQTTTGVPMLFTDEDDGGILPVHSIGLTANGAIPSGSAGLHWVAEIANGTGSQNVNAEPIQNFVDENNGKAFNLALYARPDWVRGLEIGTSFYQDRLHPAGLGAIEERIYSAHAALIRPHLELLAEGVILQHDRVGTNSSLDTYSGYGQASYQMHRFRPYFRYEYQNVPKADPIFSSLGRRNGPSVGVRYDLSEFAAFKLQYGLLSQRSGPSLNAIQAQLAFAF